MFNAAIAVAIALSGSAPSAGPDGLVIIDEGPAVISRSHQYRLRSPDGREVLVQVSEPTRPLAEGETAAVVYGLDGNYAFGKLTDVARNLQIMGEMAPAFVVSVGYPMDQVQPWAQGRIRDYIHTPQQRDNRIDGGGGGAFQAFLINELRPFIEARHPIDPDRAVLWGHSLGGLFIAGVLSTQPDAFNGYIIGSPAMWVDPTMIERVRANAATGAGAGRRVYVGVGAAESEGMLPAAQELAAALRSPGSGFEVRDRIFAEEGHITVQGALMGNGLSYLLPRAAAPAR